MSDSNVRSILRLPSRYRWHDNLLPFVDKRRADVILDGLNEALLSEEVLKGMDQPYVSSNAYVAHVEQEVDSREQYPNAATVIYLQHEARRAGWELEVIYKTLVAPFIIRYQVTMSTAPPKLGGTGLFGGLFDGPFGT
jgi:hypothetical protein